MTGLPHRISPEIHRGLVQCELKLSDVTLFGRMFSFTQYFRLFIAFGYSNTFFQMLVYGKQLLSNTAIKMYVTFCH